MSIFWQTSKVTKNDRHNSNMHKSCLIWLTGLPSAGKSTIARELEKFLFERNIKTYVLDGDNLRHGLNNNLSFSPQDRSENVRRIGEVGKLFVDAGFIAIVAAVSPYRSDRDLVRSRFDSDEFIEVFVNCPLDECEKRDVKGLYASAKKGKVGQFTGISAPYEVAENAEITIHTNEISISDSCELIINYLRTTRIIP